MILYSCRADAAAGKQRLSIGSLLYLSTAPPKKQGRNPLLLLFCSKSESTQNLRLLAQAPHFPPRREQLRHALLAIPWECTPRLYSCGLLWAASSPNPKGLGAVVLPSQTAALVAVNRHCVHNNVPPLVGAGLRPEPPRPLSPTQPLRRLRGCGSRSALGDSPPASLSPSAAAPGVRGRWFVALYHRRQALPLRGTFGKGH